MNDVLFVIPPHFRLLKENLWTCPLGLGSLVSYLKLKGFRAEIFNMDVYNDRESELFNRWLHFRKRGKPGTWVLNCFLAIVRFLKSFKLRFFRLSQAWNAFYDELAAPSNPLWREIEFVIKNKKPRMVGFSASVLNVPAILILARMIRKLFPKIRIIVGGPAACTNSEELLIEPSIDFVVIGEGEETLAELCLAVKEEEYNPAILGKIKGLIFRDGESIIKNAPRTLIQNLDALPFPDRESMFFLDQNLQIRSLIRCVDILGSRGCPYECKFCSAFVVWGTRKPRMRSAENLVKELEYLFKKFGQSYFIFWDDLFTVDRKRVVEFCGRLVDSGLHIRWECLVHVNFIDEELLQIMRRAGCIRIQIGIESGNNRVLKAIGKNIQIEIIRDKIKIIKDSGMSWLTFFIVGFPGETEEEIQDTFNFINEINPPEINVCIFSPYPGTPFFYELKEKNLLNKDYQRGDFWYTANNHTGTIPRNRFKKIADNALKISDRHNLFVRILNACFSTLKGVVGIRKIK